VKSKKHKKGSKRAGEQAVDEEDISDDEVEALGAEASQAEPTTTVKETIFVRRPKVERCLLGKVKSLPLTANNRTANWATAFVGYLRIMKTDLGSKSMVALQKLLAFAFSVEGARSLAISAQSARYSAGAKNMYKDIVSTQDARGLFHYFELADSLTNLAHQKFNNVLAEVSLLVQYVTVAGVFAEYHHELVDPDSPEYAKYKQTVEGNEREFGRLGMRSSRRRYILTKTVRGMFGEDREGGIADVGEEKKLSRVDYAQMDKHLNTALSLSYLKAAFGPGINALMLSSVQEAV
jgi:hypothetical protein